MTAPTRAQYVRMAKIVAIAVILGPLVAGLSFCVIMAGMLAFDTAGWPPTFSEAAHILAEMFAITIAVSYFGGYQTALVAGVLVALSTLWRAPNLPIVFISSLVAGIAVYMVTEPASFREVLAGSSIYATKDMAISVGGALMAGPLCWFLARRFVRIK